MTVSTSDGEMNDTGRQASIRHIGLLRMRDSIDIERNSLRWRWWMPVGIVVLLAAACGGGDSSEDSTGASSASAPVQAQTQPAPAAAPEVTAMPIASPEGMPAVEAERAPTAAAAPASIAAATPARRDGAEGEARSHGHCGLCE